MKTQVLILIPFLLFGYIFIGCDSATDSKATSVAAPELLIPEDNKTNVSLTPVFRWKNPGNIIEVSTNSNFSSPVYSNNQLNGATQNVIPAGKLMNNTTYFWRVGIVSGSNTYWSVDAFRFTTIP